MSRFDITRAYNAPFDPEIDAQLMGLVRIGFVIVTFVTGCIPGTLLYVTMALIVPAATEAGAPEAAAEQEETS